MANSVEHSTEDGMTWDRFEIDSEVTKQDLIDSCTHIHTYFSRIGTFDVSITILKMLDCGHL